MADDIYKEAFDAAQEELSYLLTQRAELDARIARLRETIVSLSYLVNSEGRSEILDLSSLGLTDAVAKVLRLSGMALTPANIKDELVRLGFDTKKYTDIIPSIVKVLQRLHHKGHVDIGTLGDNERKVYIWSPMQPHMYKLEAGTGTLELFAGAGSVPLPDVIVSNPPYERAKELLKGRPKKSALRELAEKEAKKDLPKKK